MSESLFADFAPSTRDEWVKAVQTTLRGETLDSLITKPYEGIDIHSRFHTLDDLAGIQHHWSLPGQLPFRSRDASSRLSR